MLETALLCLAMNIYHEARGEPLAGQVAVAYVTTSRVEDNRYPDNICDVVKQGVYWKGNPVRNKCQFSWWCDGKSDIPKNKKDWKKAKEIAKFWLTRNSDSPLKYRIAFSQVLTAIDNGIPTHYHTTKIKPNWSKKIEYLGVINNHIFYRENKL